MKVSFMSFGQNLASSRYRAEIPARELQAMGVQPGRDILVAGKHGWDWHGTTDGFKRVVFDVCSDHFRTKHRAFYLMACERADAVVAASNVLARRIKEETGRTAWVVEDPYEEPEGAPRVGPKLLWHGHVRNVPQIDAWRDALSYWPLTCITGGGKVLPEGCEQWSLERMRQAYDEAGMVVLPYPPGCESTNNRAINAIRRGLWPVCEPMESLADLGVWQGRLDDGVRWALDNRDEVIDRLYAAQSYIARRYSPKAIATKWRGVLETI